MAHTGGTCRSDNMSLPQEVACRSSNMLNSKPIEVQVNICKRNRSGRSPFIENAYIEVFSSGVMVLVP